ADEHPRERKGTAPFPHLLFDSFLLLDRLEIVVDVLERDDVVGEILLRLPAPGAGAEGVHGDVLHRSSSSTNTFPSSNLHRYDGTVISLASRNSPVVMSYFHS